MEIKGSSIVQSIQTVGLRLNEGLDIQAITSDVQLNKYAKKYLYCYLDADHNVTLPDATTLDRGWVISFYVKDNSEGSIYLKLGDGTPYTTIMRRRFLTIILLDNTTVGGVWGTTSLSDFAGAFRNVSVLSNGTVISAENGTAHVGNIVVAIAKGFYDDGRPIDVFAEVQTPVEISYTPGRAAYFYLHEDGSITNESRRQQGSEQLPEASIFPNGTIYYSINDAKNYKVVNGEWVEFPAVAIGEITASGQITVYTMNWWWWLLEDLTTHKNVFYNPDAETTSVQLDAVCPDPNMLTVIVGNTVLLSNAYTLDHYKTRINFAQPIEKGVHIEVRWYVPLTVVGVEGTGSGTVDFIELGLIEIEEPS